MVVRLHFEDRAKPVADIHCPGILTRPLDDTRPRRRQFLQMHARTLIRAMFRPHDRKHAKLRQVRLTTEYLDDLLVLIVRQIMLRDEVFGVDLNVTLHFLPYLLCSRDQNPCRALTLRYFINVSLNIKDPCYRERKWPKERGLETLPEKESGN